MTSLTARAVGIQRRYYFVLIILSCVAERWSSDAQGMTRIHVISDGLSFPRSRDSPSMEPSFMPSITTAVISPTPVPSLLVRVPVPTTNPPNDDPPSSIPGNEPIVASPHTSRPTSIPVSTRTSSDSPFAMPSAIPQEVVQSERTATPSHNGDGHMAVDQVLLKTNDGIIMNAGQASDFEQVCATDFLPIYLAKVYATNYTNITCTIMSQSIFDSTLVDGMESTISTLAVLLRIQSVVTPRLDSSGSPSFDDIVAEVVSAYTPKLQELLEGPEQTYFAKTSTTVESVTNDDASDHRPRTAIIVSMLSVACIILGLAVIAVSLKRYRQGELDQPVKAIRMENESTSGDSVYNDDEQQQPRVSIGAPRLHLDIDEDDHDYYNEPIIGGMMADEEPVLYEKMSLTSHRSQHERRTYNMSFIGRSSTSGVSSVTNAPSSICTNSTTMTNSILSTPGARTNATTRTSPAYSDSGGGCNAGFVIPPIVERLYYETLHGTLRLTKMESGISTSTSLSSPRRGDPYSGILSLDEDDGDEDETFNSTDEPRKPPPRLVVAITEGQQDESTARSEATSGASTQQRQGGADQKNSLVGTSLEERDSTPSEFSSRQSSGGRSSSRSSKKEKRSQRGRQRRSSPPSSRRGGKASLASSRQESQGRPQSERPEQKNKKDNANSTRHKGDDKGRVYSHTSIEEMMTDDNTEKTDTKLPSVIITITQQEITKTLTTNQHLQPRHADSGASLLPILGVLSHSHEDANTTTHKAFSSRSMSINSNSLYGGGEIIQSVETELSSVSASIETLTRGGSSSSSGEEINDGGGGGSSGGGISSSISDNQDQQQQQRKTADSNIDDDDTSSKRRGGKNRIVNI